MTIEQAIEFAREWQKGLTVYPGAMGWRVVCMVLADEVGRLQARVAELESKKLPDEQGRNRYGVDVAYFRKTINRELNRPLVNYKPDELARVLARLSVTADSSVVMEPEFQRQEALARIRAEAVREAVAALDTLDISGLMPIQKLGFCICIEKLHEYANQIEGGE